MNQQSLDFAVRLYRQMPDKGNLFFSPSSVRSALARVTIGARGKTREEMAEVLGIGGMEDEEIMRELQGAEAIAQTKDVVLAIANQIYIQEGYAFRKEFLGLMERLASLEIVDFRKAYDRVRLEINDWIAVHTRQKILNMLGQGALNALTRMVVVNATYFKGDWVYKFNEELTKLQDFFAPSEVKKAQMMSQRGTFLYTEDRSMQALCLLYNGERFGRLMILPKMNTSLHELERYFTKDLFSWILQSLMRRDVAALIPRSEISFGPLSLIAILERMGIKQAFIDGVSDFGGIISKEKDLLHISDVVHQAWEKTNEDGSEAAAATVVIMNREMSAVKPPDPIVFRADRPFMFAIMDMVDEQPLFMGRLADPSSR